MLIHHLGRQVGKGALVLVGAFFAGGTVERELDRLGVEGFAVVEGDALAQLEGIGLQIGRDFPAFGQQGRYASIGIDLGQRLIDVVLGDFRNGRGRTGRGIEPWRLQRHAKHNSVFLVLRLGGGGQPQWQRGQCACGKQISTVQHPGTPWNNFLADDGFTVLGSALKRRAGGAHCCCIFNSYMAKDQEYQALAAMVFVYCTADDLPRSRKDRTLRPRLYRTWHGLRLHGLCGLQMAPPGPHLRHCTHQLLRVGVLRMLEQLRGRAALHDFALVENDHFIAQMVDDG
ncbi:hypothetical protein D3C72_1470270 [compost metagenome]